MKRFFLVVLVIVLVFSVTTISMGKDVTVKKPVKIQVIDVAGQLQLTQSVIEAFKSANPKLVSEVEYIKATSPELTSKIKAQQMAGNIETSLVLTGYDGLAFGVTEKIWEPIMPKNKDFFPNLDTNYLEGAKKAYDLFNGFGIAVVFCPGGPMFTYNPEKVPNPPKTAQELLAWAKANPGKFLYARPGNSGPGRAFLQGLPYILGDTDPKKPSTWTKTWTFLKDLDQYIDYYPTGTGITFKELAEGTRWIIASHMGWDMNQRILATIPPTYKAFFLDNMTWVNDTQFMCIPKGLDKDRLNVTLALIAWCLKPENQAATYDSGYFYPGPAVKNVPLTMAPKESQDKVKSAVREEYEKKIKEVKNTTQLDAVTFQEASDTWDKIVGAKIKK
jgi:putative spermidine/putrescine transport system substrate-binding protein